MTFSFRRMHLAAIAAIAAIVVCSTSAPAAVDMSVGLRYVIPQGPVQECGTKAKAALNAFLQYASESPDGSGDWHATGPIGGSGPSTASAVVRCTAVGSGYVATFTCAVQTPASAYSANDLCLDVAHKFSGKTTVALATPKPPPSGCTTDSLVGTWTGNDKTFKMTLDGDLTDNDGISGNWAMYGNSATLTYYGNHSLTLSPDGKHLSGRDFQLTRKC